MLDITSRLFGREVVSEWPLGRELGSYSAQDPLKLQAIQNFTVADLSYRKEDSQYACCNPRIYPDLPPIISLVITVFRLTYRVWISIKIDVEDLRRESGFIKIIPQMLVAGWGTAENDTIQDVTSCIYFAGVG